MQNGGSMNVKLGCTEKMHCYTRVHERKINVEQLTSGADSSSDSA